MKTTSNWLLKVGLLGLLFLLGAAAPLAAKLKHRQIDGVDYVSLASVANALGMERERQGTVLTMSSKWNTLRFKETSREYLLNGLRMHLGFPVVQHRFRLYLSRLDYDKHVAALLRPSKVSGKAVVRRIVLDAGHGGHDPGARNQELGLEEKAVALDLSQRLKRILEQGGFEVVMTRNDDRFIRLEDRSLIANLARADLFLSLHFNAVGKASVQGLETFSLTPTHMPSTGSSRNAKANRVRYDGNRYDGRNGLLSYCVQSRMIKELGSKDRGMKRARFAVLKHLNCPGILIEGGFLTHAQEAVLIGSEEYREKLARSIANGVFMYHKMMVNLVRSSS